MQNDYEQLQVRVAAGVAHVTIDNAPVNALGFALMNSLRALLDYLAGDESVRVVVFDSANPEFFIAHVDMALGEDQEAVGALIAGAPEGLNPFQALNEQLRHQPQVTIVKLAGIARGGGAEFVAAADMAFAADGLARLGQVEALMGILPGGGGTQYLPERVGRNRALELALGAELMDARKAELYGLVARALPADEIDDFVDRLATQIAELKPGIANAVKRLMPPRDHGDGLIRETGEWTGLVFAPAAGALMGGAMAGGAQTPAGERDLEGMLRGLAHASLFRTG